MTRTTKKIALVTIFVLSVFSCKEKGEEKTEVSIDNEKIESVEVEKNTNKAFMTTPFKPVSEVDIQSEAKRVGDSVKLYVTINNVQNNDYRLIKTKTFKNKDGSCGVILHIGDDSGNKIEAGKKSMSFKTYFIEHEDKSEEYHLFIWNDKNINSLSEEVIETFKKDLELNGATKTFKCSDNIYNGLADEEEPKQGCNGGVYGIK